MAIEPINYLAQVPQQNFLRDIQGGLQLGLGIRQIQEQAQAQQLAQQQAQQYQSDVSAAINNPSPQAFASLALKYPQQREAFKQSWDQLDAGQRKSEGDAALQTSFALESGNPNAAKQVLQNRIQALENSGRDASHEKQFLGLVDTNPNLLRGQLLMWAANTQDPKNFAENYAKLGTEQRAQEQAPAKLRQANAEASGAESEATTKAAEAQYAEPTALAKLEGIRTDSQYKRDQTKIGYLNAQISRETNALKRQELGLQVQKAQQELNDNARAKVANAESAAGSIDNLLNTIDRTLKNPSLNSVLGSIQGRLPAVFSDEAADAIANIDTLGSQVFISQIPNIKGTGSLSEKEGDKLQASLQNLSRTQSHEQFEANLREVQRLALKSRGIISKRFGVPLGNPDTPAAADKRPPLSSFGG